MLTVLWSGRKRGKGCWCIMEYGIWTPDWELRITSGLLSCCTYNSFFYKNFFVTFIHISCPAQGKVPLQLCAMLTQCSICSLQCIAIFYPLPSLSFFPMAEDSFADGLSILCMPNSPSQSLKVLR